ncbi:hypothetical protein AAY473_008878 [Plecturocebus cupreus]
MSLIPELWEAEVEDHLRSGVRDQPGQHGETPSLLKKKNTKVSWAWWWVPVIPATWEGSHIHRLLQKRLLGELPRADSLAGEKSSSRDVNIKPSKSRQPWEPGYSARFGLVDRDAARIPHDLRGCNILGLSVQDLLILLVVLKSTERQALVLGSTGDALPQAGFAAVTSKTACQLTPGSSLASASSWQRLFILPLEDY